MKPYSTDLRERVIDKVESNPALTKKAIAQLFNISRSTIYDWIHLKKQSGSLEQPKISRPSHKRKITDLEAFKDFVIANASLSLQEMADKWSEPIGRETIRRGLKLINFTRKKKLYVPRS